MLKTKHQEMSMDTNKQSMDTVKGRCNTAISIDPSHFAPEVSRLSSGAALCGICYRNPNLRLQKHDSASRDWFKMETATRSAELLTYRGGFHQFANSSNPKAPHDSKE